MSNDTAPTTTRPGALPRVVYILAAGTAALSTSAFNTGIAAGSWVAGIALDSSLGPTGPALVGPVIVGSTQAPLTLGARSARRRLTGDAGRPMQIQMNSERRPSCVER